MNTDELSRLIPDVVPVNGQLDSQIQQFINQKTKPPGALGRLETLAMQIARVQQCLLPTLSDPHIAVFAADHGIAVHGVSAYPQEVSWQMVTNFLNGGAAINAFTRTHNIGLSVIDVGIKHDFAVDKATDTDSTELVDFVSARIRKGTADMAALPAMSVSDCAEALQIGCSTAARLVDRGSNVLGFGDMGIGNTCPASLLMSRLLELPLAQCVGRGTGLDDEQLRHKLKLLEQVSIKHSDKQSPLAALTAMGGLEIAAITGGMLETASLGKLVLVDGFIASAAYLVACQLQPAIADYAVFCHRSREPGHQLMLESLNAFPLLDLDMRLGEGSGCALAYPLLVSAVAMLNDMASFADANVSEA